MLFIQKSFKLSCMLHVTSISYIHPQYLRLFFLQKLHLYIGRCIPHHPQKLRKNNQVPQTLLYPIILVSRKRIAKKKDTPTRITPEISILCSTELSWNKAWALETFETSTSTVEKEVLRPSHVTKILETLRCLDISQEIWGDCEKDSWILEGWSV